MTGFLSDLVSSHSDRGIRTARIEQRLCRRVVKVCLGHESDPCVLALSRHPIAELIHHRFEAIKTHLERILNHQCVDRPILKSRDQGI